MSANGLRLRLGVSEDEAEALITQYWDAYHVYGAWQSELPAVMQANGCLALADGWQLFPVLDCNQRSIKNYPMQGTGSNILRRACAGLTTAGVELIGTNHDSVMVQAPIAEIDGKVKLAEQIMIASSRKLLGGHACRVDIEQVIKYPEHWSPDAGRELYLQLIGVCE
jgi:DNA polymerase-1